MAWAEDPVEEPGTETPVADTSKVTITVNRDSTYAGTTTEAGRAYTWYKIFSATYASSVSTNASGYGTDGTANVNAGEATGVSYLANATVAAVLAGEGNLWFDLQDIAGSTDKVVTWKAGVEANATNLQAAAAWLVANNAYEATGNMTFADGKWTAEVDKGYYVIKGDVGDKLIAATTDITDNEKNDYPPQDKTQADEDNTTQSDAIRSVAIGDVLTYEVKVTIPKTAAVGNTIKVYDTPSAGLTYNNDVAVKTGSNTGNATVAAATGDAVVAGAAWTQIITVTKGSQGTDVVFTFTMTVNENALTDTDRENESQIDYGNNYTSLPDEVKYTTYYTGIIKVDGTNTDTPLGGVKFELKEGDNYFPVKKDGAYYIPDTSIVKGAEETDEAFAARAKAASEVETDDNGKIIIRGLDNDKTYTLTETETKAGYNLLESPKTLALVEDTSAGYDANANFDKVLNNSGTVLPSTGGIGTTIFYVVGSILVVAAGVLLITKKRMSREG